MLRGHLFRCERRGDSAVPEVKLKGRKKTSCLSCVRLRARCDNEMPCNRCRQIGKECVRDHKEPPSPALRGHEGIPIHFLLNSPEDDDFVARFPIRQTHAERENSGNSEPSYPPQAHRLSVCERRTSSSAPFGDTHTTFDAFFGNLGNMTMTLPPSTIGPMRFPIHPDMMDPSSAALSTRALEIRGHLFGAAANLDGASDASHLKNLGPAIELVTSAEVLSCLDLYFQAYHRHCPILHKPTFDQSSAPVPLLLAMMALGAMYSENAGRVAWVRQLLDLMELYIFSTPGLRDEYEASFRLTDNDDEDRLWHHFQTFQGAYLITVAQYFSGNAPAKRRARSQRFTILVAIARAFKLPIAQHDPNTSFADIHSYVRWMRKESQVRTMNILLALDTAFGIFSNLPPRFALSELDVQLPGHPQDFALSYDRSMEGQTVVPQHKIKLNDAFRQLFEDFRNDTRHLTDLVTILHSYDMLILVHLLYTFVWQQLYSNPLHRVSASTVAPSPTMLEPLKCAIRNWKLIWDGVRASATPESVSQMGFETSADSYWTLVRLLVYAFERKPSRDTDRKGDQHECTPSIRQIALLPIESNCDDSGSHLRAILGPVRQPRE